MKNVVHPQSDNGSTRQKLHTDVFIASKVASGSQIIHAQMWRHYTCDGAI